MMIRLASQGEAKHQRILYAYILDMDNVSYDFNGGVKNLTGKSYDELTENEKIGFLAL